jgi:hypothetical protein
MTATTKAIHRAIVSLKLPTKVGDLMTHAQGIVKAMTGNPAYRDPVPNLVTITTAIAELQAAETAALTRAKGTATVRNEKKLVLVKLLLQLKAYIQAQADTNIENSGSVVQSAGVGVRKTPTHRARGFAVQAGALSGTADLVTARAASRASYEWEYSIDGGKTWILTAPTLQARTTVSGLQPGATVQFRCRSVTKVGASDWSAAVSLIVQ